MENIDFQELDKVQNYLEQKIILKKVIINFNFKKFLKKYKERKLLF